MWRSVRTNALHLLLLLYSCSIPARFRASAKSYLQKHVEIVRANSGRVGFLGGGFLLSPGSIVLVFAVSSEYPPDRR